MLARERFNVEVSTSMDVEGAGSQEDVDALVLLDQLGAMTDPVETLMKLKGRIAKHGLLLLPIPFPVDGYKRGMAAPAWLPTQRFSFTPETMHALLLRTGYALVGWEVLVPSHLTDGSAGARALAVARPA
jgi:hypothetical protein